MSNAAEKIDADPIALELQSLGELSFGASLAASRVRAARNGFDAWAALLLHTSLTPTEARALLARHGLQPEAKKL